MPSDIRLAGLLLTKPERLGVLALSYLYCAPFVWSNGRKFLRYLYEAAREVRRQLREEDPDHRRARNAAAA
jgi:hypothetical protein